MAPFRIVTTLTLLLHDDTAICQPSSTAGQRARLTVGQAAKDPSRSRLKLYVMLAHRSARCHRGLPKNLRARCQRFSGPTSPSSLSTSALRRPPDHRATKRVARMLAIDRHRS